MSAMGAGRSYTSASPGWGERRCLAVASPRPATAISSGTRRTWCVCCAGRRHWHSDCATCSGSAIGSVPCCAISSRSCLCCGSDCQSARGRGLCSPCAASASASATEKASRSGVVGGQWGRRRGGVGRRSRMGGHEERSDAAAAAASDTGPRGPRRGADPAGRDSRARRGPALALARAREEGRGDSMRLASGPGGGRGTARRPAGRRLAGGAGVAHGGATATAGRCRPRWRRK